MEGGQIGLPDLYGRSGEIAISETRGPHSLASVFVEAMAELGVPPNPSYNGEEQTGAAITHTTQRGGWRCSSARGYLDPVKHRKNLRIQTGTSVRRILFTKNRAVGVEVDADGARHTLSASREIILSAGAINSPKILMLSGIGDQQELGRRGIAVVRHCPEVGRNLQEHARINVSGEVNVPTLNTQLGPWSMMKYAFEYILWRRGTLSHVLPAIAFVKSKPDLRYPDLQFHFGAFGFTEGETLIPMAKPTVTIQPNVSRSESRGFIALRSDDPNDPPLIQPNLLASRRDMETHIAGARIARRVLRARAFAPYFQRESAPGDDVQSDEDWETYIRQTATILFHPCGTCRMGSDDGAVVDSDLRVRGAVGLRVIDASIIPQVPSGNINAISMTIGEKGADAIRSAAS
jgi:choline dehydrogenase